MRVSIAELNPEQIAALPRTTRWRAQKRGWIAPNYRQRFTNIRVLASPQFEAELAAVYRQVEKIVGYAMRARWPFPSYVDQDDLIQECIIELWRNSGKSDFGSQKWRGELIFRHLRRLRQGCRFDRDLFKRKESNERKHS